jgi:hypothetical protein
MGNRSQSTASKANVTNVMNSFTVIFTYGANCAPQTGGVLKRGNPGCRTK